MIWQHPVALTGVETGSARFQVQADGTPPLHYAWRHDSEVVPAATGDLLELRTLGIDDAGGYEAVIWNDFGTNVSRTAVLRVDPAPHGPDLVLPTSPPGTVSSAWKARSSTSTRPRIA